MVLLAFGKHGVLATLFAALVATGEAATTLEKAVLPSLALLREKQSYGQGKKLSSTVATSEATEHEVRMAKLQADLQRAMTALYAANFQDKLDSLAQQDTVEAKKHHKKHTAAPAPAGPAFQGPFGSLEPFGREDTARELTEASIAESDKMIDQIEHAVVAETKRSMFRALTRLRGVAVNSFDGMANGQATNVDDYARNKEWTNKNKIQHLAEAEGNVATWAFPTNGEQAPPGPPR